MDFRFHKKSEQLALMPFGRKEEEIEEIEDRRQHFSGVILMKNLDNRALTIISHYF